MSAEQLKISIVIPTKNSERFLKQTLDSIVAQEYHNYEVVVIDGYSTDRTKDIVLQYPKTIFLRVAPAGEPDAINKGIGVTDGDIVAYIDSDDIYQPWCFHAVNEVFSRDFIRMWLYGKGNIINENGQEIRRIVTVAKEFMQRRYSPSALACVDFIVQPSVFMRRELYDRIGQLRTDLKYSFEYDYWLRIAAAGYEPAFINRYLSSWRVHPGSISIQGYLEETDQARQIQRRYGRRALWPVQDMIYYGTRALYRVMNGN